MRVSGSNPTLPTIKMKDIEKEKQFYEELREIAIKYKKPIWTASQPKRPEGFFRTRMPERSGDIFTIDHVDMIFTTSK